MIAVPLASRIRRGGRGFSLVISVPFALGYYVLTVAGTSLGNQGKMPEIVAMWLPNLLIAIGALILLVRGEIHPGTLRQALRQARAGTASAPSRG